MFGNILTYELETHGTSKVFGTITVTNIKNYAELNLGSVVNDEKCDVIVNGTIECFIENYDPEYDPLPPSRVLNVYGSLSVALTPSEIYAAVNRGDYSWYMYPVFDGELYSPTNDTYLPPSEYRVNLGDTIYLVSAGSDYQGIMCPVPVREGYTFKGWEYDGTLYALEMDDMGRNTYLMDVVASTTVSGSPSFISVWEQSAVTITASAGEGGSISPSGSVEVSIGSNQSFSFSADEGYKVGDVTVDGVSVGSPSSYTFSNVTSSHSIEVSFVLDGYTIYAGSSEGGSISPSGSVHVAEGSGQSFSFSADEGYKVGDVTVDGVSVGSPSSYTFGNVTSDHSIDVSFVSEDPVNFILTTSSLLHYVLFTPESGEIVENMPLHVSISTDEVKGYVIKEVYVDGVLYASFDDRTTSTDVYVAHVTGDVDIYVVEAPVTGVYITPYMYDVTLVGGMSVDVGVVAWNANEGNPIHVKLYDSKLLSNKNQEVSYSVLSDDTQWGAGYLAPNDSAQFITTLTATEYSSGGNAKLILYFVVSENPGSDYGTEAIMQGIVINITIIPIMSLVEDYDKFLGIWSLGSFIDGITPTEVAFISLLFLLLILIIVVWVTYPRLKMWMERRSIPLKTKQSAKMCIHFIIFAALTFTVAKCIFINGASFRILAYTSMISNALYVICAMAVLLLITDEVKVRVLKRYAKDDSLLPLVFALLKISIVVVSFAIAFNALGTSLAYIAASLGIMTTALGFGFKSTMVRILDGIILTGTRVFKPGDLIRLNGSPQVLRVVHVGFMSTRLSNWLNSEEYIMPNDKLETAQIVNMSKGHDEYRVFIFVDVAKSVDLKKVQNVLLEVANNNEHVVKDGSRPLPRIHVNDMNGTGVNFRLAVYIDDIETHLAIAGELREQVYEAFGRNGIEIPFPQKEVRLDGSINKGAA